MGNNKTPGGKSRRDFLSLFSLKDTTAKPEMVKMLTADGKLVEVEKSIVDKMAKKQKASNKDIYNWMDNPSKDNS